MTNHTTHHEHSHASHIKDFKRRFIISSLLTIPILVLSPMIWKIFGFRLDFAYREYLLILLASIIFVYGGKPFLQGAFQELKSANPGMMTLIATAIGVAYFYSLYSSLQGGKEFFWELATLIDIMLLGHYIEAKAVLGASDALQDLVRLIPKHAHKVTIHGVEEVPISSLAPGDTILIKPGEKIPADGVVIEGASSVDEAFITGESKPVFKEPSKEVFMGSTNLDGIMKVQIAKNGQESFLYQIIALVKEAQQSRSKTQNLANRAAKWLFFIALGTSGLTFGYWAPLLGSEQALLMAVSVLIIACPHALGLAVPLVVAISTTIAAKNGILIRNREAFENLKNIYTLCLDKTGTITEGKLYVENVATTIDKKELFGYVYAVEQNSEHPIAQTIVRYLEKLGSVSREAHDFKNIPGIGTKALVDQKEILVGGSNLLEKFDLAIPKELEHFAKSTYTKVYVAIDKKVAGVFLLGDRIRDESKKAIAALKARGIATIMLTGDNEKVAQKVAQMVRVDSYYANLLPQQKVALIKQLKKNGKVAMVGDGINDAPALLEGDIGIAIGAGTDIAANSADLILTKNSLFDVLRALTLSQKTYKKMVQNLWWASGYNIFALPLAAGVLYNAGIVIEPAVGAALMSASTVIVALNAQLLKRIENDALFAARR